MESIFKLGIVLSVIDRVSGPSRTIGAGMDSLKGKVMALGPAFDKFKTYGLVVMTVAAGMLNMMSGTVMAQAASEKALGELSSVGIQNLQALEQAGQDFSGTWAGTTKAQFITAAYDIKSGIASLSDEGVAEFTRLAALTGKATKASTAEMTSLFATGYGIYKDMYAGLSDMQFGEVFSGGIAASVKAFKTTGSGMAQAISTLGASATSAKVPLQEQLTILGMLQATMTGSEAGTKYRALMQSAASAGEKLNLRFLDANRQLLSMPEILTTLRKKYGDTLDAMEKLELQKAFGTDEAVQAINLLYGKVGELTNNITGIGTAMDQGAAFTEVMAKAMNQDIGAGIALLGQRMNNLMGIIGKQLIPVLLPLFVWIGNVINRLTQLAQEHSTFTRILVIGIAVIASAAFVLGSLAAVLGAAGLLFPNVVTGFNLVSAAAGVMKIRILAAVASTKFWILWQRQAFLTALYFHGGILGLAKALATSFLTAIKAAIVSVRTFTMTLLANPITWIVIGVVALGAALWYLYKRFEIVRTAVQSVLYFFGWLLGSAVKLGKGLLAALLHPLDFLTGAWTNIFQVIAKAMFDGFKANIASVLSWIKGLAPEFLASGKALWTSFTDGVRSMVTAPVESVKSGLSRLGRFFPHSDAKEGPLSTLTLSGSRLMETLGAGITAGAPGLAKVTAGALAGVMATTGTITPFPGSASVTRPAIIEPAVKYTGSGLKTRLDSLAKPVDTAVSGAGGNNRKTETNIHIHGLTLPGVTDTDSFFHSLIDYAESHNA